MRRQGSTAEVGAARSRQMLEAGEGTQPRRARVHRGRRSHARSREGGQSASTRRAVEPPPSRWVFPNDPARAGGRRRRRRGGRDRRRPGARHPAGRLPVRALSDAGPAGTRWPGGHPTPGGSSPWNRRPGCGSADRCGSRAPRFEIRVDTAFDEVIEACADRRRPGAWIDRDIKRAYRRLHELGWVHSVEAWDERRPPGRRAVRRGHRGPVRRRVDVPPPDRRVQGGAGRPGIAVAAAKCRRRGPGRVCSTCSGPRPHLVSLGAVAGEPGPLPRAAGRRPGRAPAGGVRGGGEEPATAGWSVRAARGRRAGVARVAARPATRRFWVRFVLAVRNLGVARYQDPDVTQKLGETHDMQGSWPRTVHRGHQT